MTLQAAWLDQTLQVCGPNGAATDRIPDGPCGSAQSSQSSAAPPWHGGTAAGAASRCCYPLLFVARMDGLLRIFARPSRKRPAEHQTARRTASKLQAPREEKGQCAFEKLQSPSPGTTTHGGGEEGAETALEQCGQSGRGSPARTKGPQC